MAEYPQREPYFAFRFVRLMAKVALANELGSDVCWLLTVVAMQEDAKRYRSAVTYYNGQLAPLCGLSEKALVRARTTAIETGWLHYIPGGNRQAGKYWCVIPDSLNDVSDGPMDESSPAETAPEKPPEKSSTDGSTSNLAVERAVELSSTAEMAVELAVELAVERALTRRLNGSRTVTLSTLYPNPIPNPEINPPLPPVEEKTLGGEEEETREQAEEFLESKVDAGRPDLREAMIDEIAFLDAWSNAKGVVPYPDTSLPHALRTKFRSPRFRAMWRSAVKKLPLMSTRDGPPDQWLPSVPWILEPANLESILGGKYDFSRKPAGASDRTAAATFNPATAGSSPKKF